MKPSDKTSNEIREYLVKNRDWPFIIYTSLFAFIVYSCMYAFRKPFTVAIFESEYFLGLDLKIWLIASQILGYTLSKFIGIKLVSEMKTGRRALSIVVLTLFAEIALFFFGWIQSPYRIIFLFFNGLPLGLIWGLVFSYLEGRKYTEMLGAGLSVSFIFASGFVKSTGKWLMLEYGVSEYWMPFTTGLIFILPLIAAVYLLNLVPSPSMEDIQMRTERKPMTSKERKAFFMNFSTAIVLLILSYALLNIFREIRDNYAAEIWSELGFADDPGIFTIIEIPIAIMTLVIMGLVTFIRDNTKALFSIIALVIIGFLLIGGSTYLYEVNIFSGSIWMICAGLGLYMAYIPFNALLFERMIAAFRYTSNIGFVMYLADSFGYLSSILSFIMKHFFSPDISWLSFFIKSSYYIAFIGIALMVLTARWFFLKKQKEREYKVVTHLQVPTVYGVR